MQEAVNRKLRSDLRSENGYKYGSASTGGKVSAVIKLIFLLEKEMFETCHKQHLYIYIYI